MRWLVGDNLVMLEDARGSFETSSKKSSDYIAFASEVYDSGRWASYCAAHVLVQRKNVFKALSWLFRKISYSWKALSLIDSAWEKKEEIGAIHDLPLYFTAAEADTMCIIWHRYGWMKWGRSKQKRALIEAFGDIPWVENAPVSLYEKAALLSHGMVFGCYPRTVSNVKTLEQYALTLEYDMCMNVEAAQIWKYISLHWSKFSCRQESRKREFARSALKRAYKLRYKAYRSQNMKIICQ